MREKEKGENHESEEKSPRIICCCQGKEAR